MAETKDLGTRIELVSMDPRFHDITIGLYRQDASDGPAYLPYSYSHREGTADRLASIRRAMATLGGMELAARDGQWLRFPCGAAHQAAARRIFLEACKLPGEAEVRSLAITDKKSGLDIRIDSEGAGSYRVEASGAGEDSRKRAAAIAGGLAKLGEMARPGGTDSDRVTFDCGQSHDAAIGVLLPRALNVRIVLREEEMNAARGVLVAPSAQR